MRSAPLFPNRDMRCFVMVHLPVPGKPLSQTRGAAAIVRDLVMRNSKIER